MQNNLQFFYPTINSEKKNSKLFYLFHIYFSLDYKNKI